MSEEPRRDVSTEPWEDIVSQCPFECELANPGPDDYFDAVGDYGLPCKRTIFNYVKGTLTVQRESWGWRFKHPGMHEGSVFVNILNGDTSPRYHGVYIRR